MAVRGTKNGKAADLMGWTKELFSIVLREMDDQKKMQIEYMFIRMANGKMPEIIDQMIRTDKGLFIGIETKKRGVLITSYFSKILWRMAFDRNIQHFKPQSIFGTIARIQNHLSSGGEVLKTDGANAFFNIRRQRVFQSISHIECPLLRSLWNLTYSRSSAVIVVDKSGKFLTSHMLKTGVKAGCASGSKLFIAGLHFMTSKPHVAAIVDDVYFFKPNGVDDVAITREDVERSAREDAKCTGVDFFGSKTKWIAPGDAPVELLGGVVAPDPRLPIQKILEAKLASTTDLLLKLVMSKLPLHTKFVIFRTATLRIKFVFRATHLRLTPIAESIDKFLIETFAAAFDIKHLPEDRHALISIPMGQGGLGIPNITALSKLYWNKQLAEGGVQGEKYPHIDQELSEDGATMAHIQSLPMSIIVKSIVVMEKAPSIQLLGVIPRDSTKLSDLVFEALLLSKLQYLPDRYKPPCKMDEGTDLYAHFVACHRCRQGITRHNTVNYELSRCIPKIGICVSLQTSHLPLPGDTPSGNARNWSDKTVAGPDMLVFDNPQHAIDLTIVNPIVEGRDSPSPRARCCIARASQKKRDTYTEWQKTYDMQCKSFVMSTNGFFSYDAVSLLGQYAEKRGTWFISWTQLRLQIKLCEAQAAILHMMKARTAAAPYTTEAASSQAV
jgi:hypothetical protein